MVTCPECELSFDVVWQNNPICGPEYCPMCGAEIDYEALYEDGPD